MSKANLIISSLTILTALVSGGCSEQKQTSETSQRQNTKEIFSDRSAEITDEWLMVQLNHLPLLEVTKEVDGKITVPEEALLAVLEEQNQFEIKLQNLSPDIEVIYRYKYTINAISLRAPSKLIPEIQKLSGVKSSEKASIFSKPETTKSIMDALTASLDENTSVNFIGAKVANDLGYTGKNVSVGVIDTGVDYTHSLLGGTGKVEDYASVDPSKPTPFFPNDKVVGGIDLVGTTFKGGSDIPAEKFPRGDSNPMDEAGHGTHVAGTVAGLGDGINTHNGVAPDAKIHGIKVFGKEGSTFDAIVVAAFEYAMDPNGDGDISDRLDVINLSLGGGFGSPKILYTKAVQNLSRAGMIVVAAAGNSGDVSFVVGAPGTADEAISVAASVDSRKLNWQFPTLKVIFADGTSQVSKFVEGNISKPLKEVSELNGPLVDIGLADQDLSDEVKAKLNGKIALIKRGGVPFLDKLKRAQGAGAKGALVYNNEPGEPIAMGGDGKVEISAAMVTLELGSKIAAAIKTSEVLVDLKNPDLAEEPALIDSITDFSSRGPRSEDYAFKPEVAAPGEKILSAEFGKGTLGVLNNGTSMASPHIAGVAAVLRQKHPTLSPDEIKALMMNTAKPLLEPKSGVEYALSSQGAGRIQLDKAIQAKVLVTSSVSLGLVDVPQAEKIAKTLTLKNLTDSPMELAVQGLGTGLTFDAPSSVTLPANGELEIPVSIQVLPFIDGSDRVMAREINGKLVFSNAQTSVSVPVLGLRVQRSNVQSSDLTLGEVIGESSDLAASFNLTNTSDFIAYALPFNLIGKDDKKGVAPGQEWKSAACDLESVGYRWMNQQVKTEMVSTIQFAFQLYSPMNNLMTCDLSILIDGNGDGEIDQEIIGIGANSVVGLQDPMTTAVLDHKKARAIRETYETGINLGLPVGLNYQAAVIWKGPVTLANFSGIVVLEVPVEHIQAGDNFKFNAKFASINLNGEALEPDDYLGDDETTWRTLSKNKFDHGFWGMPEVVELSSNSIKRVDLNKSLGQDALIIYAPTNNKAFERLVISP